MKRLFLAAVVGLAITINGCGSGGGVGLAALQQAFQQCSQTSMFHLLRLINGAGAVIAVAQGNFPPPGTNVSFGPSANPSDPPNTFDFTVSLDINANGALDTFLVGQATFSEDPTDGLLPGSTVDLVYQIRNTPLTAGGLTEQGTLTGSVDVTVGLVGPQTATLEGTVVLNDSAGGCNATLVFPALTPFQLNFPEPILSGPILDANVAGIELFGEIAATLTALGQTFQGTILLIGGSQEASVSGMAGSNEINLSFDIFPAPEVIEPLVECFELILGLAEVVVSTFGEVVDAELEDLIAGNVPGVSLTPTANPAVFNYMIDLDEFSGSGLSNATLTGQVTLTFSGLEVTRVAFTWSLLAEGILQGVTTVSGQNAQGRPIVIDFDAQGDPDSLHGAGSFTTPECTGTFDIPANAPIFSDTATGRVNLSTSTQGNTLVTTFLVGLVQQFTNVTINGIPIPADLFQQFIFFGNGEAN